MPKPLAICLEDTAAQDDCRRYLRCVALVGRQPGLRVDAIGKATWLADEHHEEAIACELWVSADDRLILFRPEGASQLSLHRGNRSLEIPENKPVVVIQGDIIERPERWSIKLHVHGWVSKAAEPSYYSPPSWKKGAKVAAAVALSAAVAAGACGAVEVRDEPPSIAVEEEPYEPPPEPPLEPQPPEEQQAEPEPVDPAEPIDVRDEPPAFKDGEKDDG